MFRTNSKHNEGSVNHTVHATKHTNNHSGHLGLHTAARRAAISDSHDMPAASLSRLSAQSNQQTPIEAVVEAKRDTKADNAVVTRAESYLARGVFGLVVMKL